MKTCTLCKQQKPTNDFGKHAQKKDGLSSWCKSCANKNAKERMSTEQCKKHKQAYDAIRRQNEDVRNKAKKASRDRYNKDKAKWKQDVLDWQKQHPEETKAYKKNNKYKRREVVSNSGITPKELSVWETTQPKICTYCNKMCKTDYQIDHIEPLSKGGKHSIDNLTISCPTCNQSKSNTSLLLWMAKTKTLRS